MGIDLKTLAAAKKYVKESLEGIGAIQGKPGKDGNDGFSPTVKEKVNSDTEYILTISDKNGSYDTPNLKGSNIEGNLTYATDTEIRELFADADSEIV